MSIFKHRVTTLCLKIHKIQNAIYYRAEYSLVNIGRGNSKPRLFKGFNLKRLIIHKIFILIVFMKPLRLVHKLMRNSLKLFTKLSFRALTRNLL